MKVVHVLKKVEMIDSDIKELRKLEKTVAKNKSFSTPIYMSIEKQINIMLDARIKLLGLKIENPPEDMISEFSDSAPEEKTEEPSEEKQRNIKKTRSGFVKEAPAKRSIVLDDDFDVDDEMPMLTQDLIDQKIKNIKTEKEEKTEEKKDRNAKAPSYLKEVKEEHKSKDSKDDDIKLLDIALEKGSLASRDPEKEKKVRFFRENFPVD